MMISLFLASSHDAVCGKIKNLLDTESWLTVKGCSSHGEEVLNRVSDSLPDVVLLDMHLSDMTTLECIQMLKNEFPSVRVIILSTPEHEASLSEMLDAGANGFILKDSPKDEMLFAIKKVAAGSKYIYQEFTMNMLARNKASEGNAADRQRAIVELSDREMDVLVLIAEGLTNIEIAQKLFTSVRTIETRRKKLLEKTGTTNTATLIRFSVVNGIIK